MPGVCASDRREETKSAIATIANAKRGLALVRAADNADTQGLATTGSIRPKSLPVLSATLVTVGTREERGSASGAAALPLRFASRSTSVEAFAAGERPDRPGASG